MEDVRSTWHWHWSFHDWTSGKPMNIYIYINTWHGHGEGSLSEALISKHRVRDIAEVPEERHGIAAPKDGGRKVHRQGLASARHSNDHHWDSAFLGWVGCANVPSGSASLAGKVPHSEKKQVYPLQSYNAGFCSTLTSISIINLRRSTKVFRTC